MKLNLAGGIVAAILLVALIMRSAVIRNVSTMSTVGPVNSIPAFVGDLGRLICQFEKGVIRVMLASKGPVPPPNFNAPVAISPSTVHRATVTPSRSSCSQTFRAP